MCCKLLIKARAPSWLGLKFCIVMPLPHLLLFEKKKVPKKFKLFLGSKIYLRTKRPVNFFRDWYASANPLNSIPIAACFVLFLFHRVKVYWMWSLKGDYLHDNQFNIRIFFILRKNFKQTWNLQQLTRQKKIADKSKKIGN